MKAYFIFLVLTTFYLQGQNTNKTNLNIKEIRDTEVGFFPRGNGEFIYQSYLVGNGRKKNQKNLRNPKYLIMLK